MVLIVTCPWCNVEIIIEKINCAIFRHAVYKISFEQVPPHLAEIECKLAISQDLVWGCCLPFEILNEKATKCEYK